MLLVPFNETSKQDFLQVSLPIAVCIFGIEDIWSGGDQHTFLPGKNSVGERNSIKKQGRLVIDPVAVGVFEETDSSSRFSFVVHSARVVSHLGNPELAIRSPIHRNRVHRQRFMCHQIDSKAGSNLHRLPCCSRVHGIRNVIVT